MENSGRLHSNGENVLYSGRGRVKKEKKMARLSFGKKKKLPDFSPKLPMENAGKYFRYKSKSSGQWKTRWKKWKTMWETPRLFHKSGGKPSGKSG